MHIEVVNKTDLTKLMLDVLRIPGFTNKKMKRGRKYQKLPDMHWREESIFLGKREECFRTSFQGCARYINVSQGDKAVYNSVNSCDFSKHLAKNENANHKN